MSLQLSIEVLRTLEDRQWALNTVGKARMSNWVLSLAHLVERLRVDGTGRVSGEGPKVKACAEKGLLIIISPDPVLTGIQMAQTVQGIQSSGVMACAKHLIGNEQEHFRQVPEAAGYGYTIDESVSSNIDDITMHELYLWYAFCFPSNDTPANTR